MAAWCPVEMTAGSGWSSFPTGRVIHAAAAPIGAVTRILAAPGGEAIVAGVAGVGWWRPETGEWRHVVSAAVATDAAVAGGQVQVFGAGTLAAWSVVAGGAAHRVATLGGLASVAWSPDGAHVAFGGGDGSVHVVAARDGSVRRVRITDQVVKSLAFDAGGTTLAVGLATDDGLRLLDAATLVERPGPWREPTLRVRRLAYLDDDVVVAFPYHRRPSAYAVARGEPVAIAALDAPVLDVAVTVPPAAAYVLDATGALWRYGRDRRRALPAAPGARAVAVSGDGRLVAIVRGDGVSVELRAGDDDAGRSVLVAPGAAIVSAALDRDGRRLALARLDGMVELWRTADRTRVLAVRAHAGRAAAVAFSPDGCTLATASWDATGRLLELCRD